MDLTEAVARLNRLTATYDDKTAREAYETVAAELPNGLLKGLLKVSLKLENGELVDALVSPDDEPKILHD